MVLYFDMAFVYKGSVNEYHAHAQYCSLQMKHLMLQVLQILV